MEKVDSVCQRTNNAAENVTAESNRDWSHLKNWYTKWNIDLYKVFPILRSVLRGRNGYSDIFFIATNILLNYMRQLFTISMILAYIEEKMYLLSINMKNFIAKKLIRITAAAAAKSLESCPTLCDPIDRSPPGSPVPGILQARTLEWVAISFSNAGKWKVRVKLLSRVRLFETPWTAAYQAPPSMGFPRQEYWSGVSLPSPTRITSRPKIPIFTGNWSSLKVTQAFSALS